MIVAAAVLGSSLLVAWAVTLNSNRAELESIDALLTSSAKTFKPKSATKPGAVVKELNALAINVIYPDSSNFVATQILSERGLLGLPEFSWHEAQDFCSEATTLNTSLGPFRVKARCPQQERFIVVVGTSLVGMQERLASNLNKALGTSVVTSIITLTLVWWGLAGTFSRLRNISKSAHAIEVGDLDSTIPQWDGNDELVLLSNALQSMVSSLKTKIHDLEASATNMRKLISVTGHELRTPLTVIQGYSEILNNRIEFQSPANQTAISRIVSETQRLDRLIQQILDFQSLTNERVTSLEWIDVSAIFREYFEDLQNLASTISIHYKLPVTYLWGNTHLIRRIASNLVQNISRHANSGSRVEVLVESRESQVLIEVSDNGPGLDVQRVIEILENLDKGMPVTSEKGLGLGLGIVKDAVTYHKGSLELSRNNLGGLSVLITLPIDSRTQ